MPAKLFSLNGVPDDEAEDVRALLAASEMDFYETPAGNWGISASAIWLSDESQLEAARALIAEYQDERLVSARETYATLKKAGQDRTLADVVRDNPLRVLVYLAAIAVIIYFSTSPFLGIGK